MVELETMAKSKCKYRNDKKTYPSPAPRRHCTAAVIGCRSKLGSEQTELLTSVFEVIRRGNGKKYKINSAI